MIKRNLLIVVALLLCSQAVSAQDGFSITPIQHQDSLINIDPASIDTHKFGSVMANASNDTLPIRWKIISINRPPAWHVSISDINQSVILSPSFLNNGGSLTLDLLPNFDNAVFNLHFHPQQTSGCGDVWIEISNYETQAVYDTIRYDFFLNACDNTVSTNELSNDEIAVNIFPNPVSEYLTIDAATYPMDIALFNSVGKIVYQERQIAEESINVAGLSSGIYFLSIDNGNDPRAVLKFIKQ